MTNYVCALFRWTWFHQGQHYSVTLNDAYLLYIAVYVQYIFRSAILWFTALFMHNSHEKVSVSINKYLIPIPSVGPFMLRAMNSCCIHTVQFILRRRAFHCLLIAYIYIWNKKSYWTSIHILSSYGKYYWPILKFYTILSK